MIEVSEVFAAALVEMNQVGGIARELCRIIRKDGDPELYKAVGLEFRSYLKDSGQEDEPEAIVRYFIRLASHPSRLVSEEMWKLILLRDEIQSLFELEVVVFDRFEVDGAFRDRIRRQKKMAVATLAHLREDWNSNWWWYQEGRGNVQPASIPGKSRRDDVEL